MAAHIPCKRCGEEHEDTLGDAICADCREPKEFPKSKQESTKNPLLHACQMAYRKHHKNDDSIGWDELSDILLNALCESMGDDEFVKWNE